MARHGHLQSVVIQLPVPFGRALLILPVGGGHHGGGHIGVVVGGGEGAGDVGVGVRGDVNGPGVGVVMAGVGRHVALGRGGEGRHSGRGDSGARGVNNVLVVGGGRGVGRGGRGHANVLAQAVELVLEGLVAAEEILREVPELVALALHTLNVLLGASADGALSLTIVGAFAFELVGGEGRDAATAWRRRCQLFMIRPAEDWVCTSGHGDLLVFEQLARDDSP